MGAGKSTGRAKMTRQLAECYCTHGWSGTIIHCTPAAHETVDPSPSITLQSLLQATDASAHFTPPSTYLATSERAVRPHAHLVRLCVGVIWLHRGDLHRPGRRILILIIQFNKGRIGAKAQQLPTAHRLLAASIRPGLPRGRTVLSYARRPAKVPH